MSQHNQNEMVSRNNAKQVGDTTYTKIFVGGLAWETKSDTLKHYFEQFGEISEAVVITERNSGRSKGYGFVTFKKPDSAIRACQNPCPVIDGRRANCNLAALGAQRSNPYTTGREKFSTTSWPMVSVPFQGTYNQHIPQYAFPYPPYRYPGYPPTQEIYAMNYYNVYGGLQVPIRWPSAYIHPFYGVGQVVAPAYVKKARYPDPSSPELFTVVGLSEPISASPSLSTTELVSGTGAAASAATAGMAGTSPDKKS